GEAGRDRGRGPRRSPADRRQPAQGPEAARKPGQELARHREGREDLQEPDAMTRGRRAYSQRPGMGGSLVLLAAFGLAAAGGAEPQEAILPDGRRLAGALTWGGDGRLRFVPSGKAAALRLDQILQVRWPGSSPPTDAGWRLLVHGGQSVSGTFVALDAQHL